MLAVRLSTEFLRQGNYIEWNLERIYRSSNDQGKFGISKLYFKLLNGRNVPRSAG